MPLQNGRRRSGSGKRCGRTPRVICDEHETRAIVRRKRRWPKGAKVAFAPMNHTITEFKLEKDKAKAGPDHDRLAFRTASDLAAIGVRMPIAGETDESREGFKAVWPTIHARPLLTHPPVDPENHVRG